MARIIAFTDTHHDEAAIARVKEAIQREQPDVAVCVGDFTVFGRDTKRILKMLNDLGVPLVLIHGNHEDEDEVAQLLPQYKNIHYAHLRVVDIAGLRFIGFGGKGFARREPEFEEFEQEHAQHFNDRTVVLCHQPPIDTKLDEVEPGWHVGSETLMRLIKRRHPLLALCGHIHECFHCHDRVGRTTVINPGPDGEIIDIE